MWLGGISCQVSGVWYSVRQHYKSEHWAPCHTQTPSRYDCWKRPKAIINKYWLRNEFSPLWANSKRKEFASVGVYSKRQEFADHGSTVFPFSVDLFGRDWRAEMQTGSNKNCLPGINSVKNNIKCILFSRYESAGKFQNNFSRLWATKRCRYPHDFPLMWKPLPLHQLSWITTQSFPETTKSASNIYWPKCNSSELQKN